MSSTIIIIQNSKLQQTNDDFKQLYQNAQAGGVEGRGEIDDSAPGRVDGERADSHVSGSAQQVPDQTCPASCPAQCSVLPVSHDIKVKGEPHVLCQFLQQVDAVPVAALPQVLRQVWQERSDDDVKRIHLDIHLHAFQVQWLHFREFVHNCWLWIMENVHGPSKDSSLSVFNDPCAQAKNTFSHIKPGLEKFNNHLTLKIEEKEVGKMDTL